MAKICGKISEVFEKKLECVRNDVDMWKMDKICVERA